MYTGGVPNSLSSLWIYITYTFILFVYLHPFVDELTKRGEEFWVYICMLDFYLCIYVYVCLVYMLHWISLLFYYAWVKWELLWSLPLIHEYITLWVFLSSKRGRLLAQRPITLVLMMINSYSYSINELVVNKF